MADEKGRLGTRLFGILILPDREEKEESNREGMNIYLFCLCMYVWNV